MFLNVVCVVVVVILNFAKTGIWAADTSTNFSSVAARSNGAFCSWPCVLTWMSCLKGHEVYKDLSALHRDLLSVIHRRYLLSRSKDHHNICSILYLVYVSK